MKVLSYWNFSRYILGEWGEGDQNLLTAQRKISSHQSSCCLVNVCPVSEKIGGFLKMSFFWFDCLPVPTLISLFYACIIYKGGVCVYVRVSLEGAEEMGGRLSLS